MITISRRGDSTKVKGEFYVTYKATRLWNGNKKEYIAIYLNSSGSVNSSITADELNLQWSNNYKGKCPFNGDNDFQVISLQQILE